MKKLIVMVFSISLFANTAYAKTDLTCPDEILKKTELTVLTKGEPFSYPLPDGAIIECYAKRLDGSIDEFEEYKTKSILHFYEGPIDDIYWQKLEKEIKSLIVSLE